MRPDGDAANQKTGDLGQLQSLKNKHHDRGADEDNEEIIEQGKIGHDDFPVRASLVLFP
jgi:hypothetical protein